MCEQDIERLLERHGIRRGSKSWQDYERAKRIIRDMAISPDEYDSCIGAITKYLRV